jgi:tetratricopeptide (TPR) repeat protein
MRQWIVAAAALVSVSLATASADEAFDAQLLSLARAWDHAQFEVTPERARLTELRRVEAQANALASQHPQAAEPMVWQAIILSSEAGAEGGLGALGKVTQARDILLRAERIDANALGDASIYTSLGSLYAQVPGFPIGFGSRDRARDYLTRALAANPNGIEPNFFMADFLVRQHDYRNAATYLRRAQNAPARPGREVADAGRRREIAAMLIQVQDH